MIFLRFFKSIVLRVLRNKIKITFFLRMSEKPIFLFTLCIISELVICIIDRKSIYFMNFKCMILIIKNIRGILHRLKNVSDFISFNKFKIKKKNKMR